MIISHTYKFIFIQPKKTGTTAIGSALSKNLESTDIIIDNKNRHDNLINFSLDPKILKEYYIFSCRRNPWARLLSFYYWARYNSPRHKLAKELEFLPWLERRPITKDLEVCWKQTCDRDGNQLASKICAMENLQEDFDEVCDSTGMPRMHLPHVNTTDHEHYSTYYDERSKNITEKIYKLDIEKFGYKFEVK